MFGFTAEKLSIFPVSLDPYRKKIIRTSPDSFLSYQLYLCPLAPSVEELTSCYLLCVLFCSNDVTMGMPLKCGILIQIACYVEICAQVFLLLFASKAPCVQEKAQLKQEWRVEGGLLSLPHPCCFSSIIPPTFSLCCACESRQIRGAHLFLYTA